MSKVLITGGAGLIGIGVCRLLAEQGQAVRLLDTAKRIESAKALLPESIETQTGSIMQPRDVMQAMTGCDRVAHLAAMVGVARTERMPRECLDINIEGTRHVLDAAMTLGISKFVFASSSEVYGEPTSNPISESHATQGKTVYGISKLAGEEFTKAAGWQGGLPWTILRLFNVYGPWQSRQFVVPLFVDAVRRGEAPVVFGDGRQSRGFAYIDDTAHGVIRAMEPGVGDGQTLNLGKSDEPVMLIDLANAAIEAGGRSGELMPKILGSFDGSDRDAQREIHQRTCDSSLAKEKLGWSADVSLAEGLKKMFESDPSLALPMDVEGE